MKRRYWWLGGIAAIALAIAGCSGGTAPPAATPTTQSTPDQTQASAQADFEAEVNAANRTAVTNVHSLEVRLQKERSADGKLNLIMTRYCQLGGTPDEDSTEKSAERSLLENLFDKYWHAGGKWNRPIWSATQQHGGCPAEFSTSPPPVGG